MGEFEEIREKWLDLIKQTKVKEAGEIYWEKLFPTVEKRFLEKNQIKEEYDWLILPVGLESSYYILLIKSINPKNVYILCTKEFKSLGLLDKVIEETNIKPSQLIVDTLEYKEMDVAGVYEKIRKHLDLFSNKKVILDLTRGKRVMSTGAGITGSFFGFDQPAASRPSCLAVLRASAAARRGRHTPRGVPRRCRRPRSKSVRLRGRDRPWRYRSGSWAPPRRSPRGGL